MDQLDDSLRKEMTSLRAVLVELPSAADYHADARTRQLEWEIEVVVAQADLNIAKMRISPPERSRLEGFTKPRYYALNGDATQEARSQYLDAYEEAIKTHKASLMAEDMELVALHLSWGTERTTSMRSCKLHLDEKWTQRVTLRRQRAVPVQTAYNASTRSCRDDLEARYATAAHKHSERKDAVFRNRTELSTKSQELKEAIRYECFKEKEQREAQFTEIREEHCRQIEKLHEDYKSRRSSLKASEMIR
jgi:hypothetical protein